MVTQLVLLLAASASPVAVSMFGVSVAGTGDVDGDGVPDVLVAAPVNGHCYLMSGKDGHVLRVLPNGTEVAGPGDVDGDGIPDLLIGAAGWPQEGPARASVYSGKDGKQIYQYPGEHVAVIGDFDRDGRRDFIVGSEVHSGRNGSILLSIPGANLHAVGDVDGDGTIDLASLLDSGARVYSGKDGTLLHTFCPWNGRPAACVIGAGDLDGDKASDLVIGYPDEECDFGGNNYVRVLSGKTGAVIHDFVSQDALFGASLCVPGDIDGDGHPDLVVGAYDTMAPGWGKALVFSGATWKQINELWSDESERGFGIALDALGDVDKDGVGDFVVGACKWTWPGGPAYAFVYSGKTQKIRMTLSMPESASGQPEAKLR